MKGQKYQLIVVTPVLSAQKLDRVEKAVKKALTEEKGAIEKVESWGIKDFAYPIEKFKRGAYWIYHFQASSFQSKKLNVFLNRQKEIIRYLLLKEEA